MFYRVWTSGHVSRDGHSVEVKDADFLVDRMFSGNYGLPSRLAMLSTLLAPESLTSVCLVPVQCDSTFRA